MGKVKDWAMTHQECPVCGKCFLPWERKEKDNGILTMCSDICDNEASQLMDEMSDNLQGDSDERRKQVK